tara:strand:- start:382 stop:714 length:333 start_codon:yes stop_codon:yes gene_type:complete
VDPGSLRYKVKITKPSTLQNAEFGDMNTLSGVVFNRFCDIIHQSVDNGEENSVEQFQKKLKFIFRFESFFKDLRETSTITYDSEIFRINGIRFRGSGNKCYVEILGKSFE